MIAPFYELLMPWIFRNWKTVVLSLIRKVVRTSRLKVHIRAKNHNCICLFPFCICICIFQYHALQSLYILCTNFLILGGNVRFSFAKRCTHWNSKQWGLVTVMAFACSLMLFFFVPSSHLRCHGLCSYWGSCFPCARFLWIPSLSSGWFQRFGNCNSSAS
jgi:hypothetical protein